MSQKRKTRDVFRSAVNGQFITRKKAEKNPRESIKQRMPIKRK